jgi:phosphoribosylanthranilate isomerase
MWIKICGMTSEQAVAAAVGAGVDAIGFVFAPSVRQLEPARAAELAVPARGRVRCVAVTLHPTQELLERILREFDPDVLQIDLEDLVRLRLPSSLSVLPVLRAGATTPDTSPSGAWPRALPQRLLFEGLRSGTGLATDWGQAAVLATCTQLVLAGGLSALNVAAAIAAVRPFGVDVSSGVEAAPGHKDPRRIVEFVQVARAAFAGVEHEHRNRN